MKRVFLLFLMVMTTMIADAQYKNGQYLACTGNGILLRTGPGKNYPAITFGDSPYSSEVILTRDSFDGNGVDVSDISKCQIIDSSIKYLGKKQNGYLYVEGEIFNEIDSHDNFVYKGWVPEKYFKSACSKCEGRGYLFDIEKFANAEEFDRCPRCHGRGY